VIRHVQSPKHLVAEASRKCFEGVDMRSEIDTNASVTGSGSHLCGSQDQKRALTLESEKTTLCCVQAGNPGDKSTHSSSTEAQAEDCAWSACDVDALSRNAGCQ
jgi:hypothetical protein